MSETFDNNSNISRYRIVAKIGADGMGKVYLAEVVGDAERMHRFVQATKTVSAVRILTPKVVAMNFFAESKCSKKIPK